MKPAVSAFVVLLLELLIALESNNISFCKGSSNMGCIVSEREALLRFKKDLKDSSNRLASWNLEGDCCMWAGVFCDNATGHVLQLQLRRPLNQIDNDYASEAETKAYESSMLGGKINPSLLNLMQLTYLDLSLNNFGGIEVPKFLGSMRNLRYLNLSDAGFDGLIPHQIGNLSNLQHLDLSGNYLQVESLHWLSGLSLLKHLDLSDVDLSAASDWLSIISQLPSLAVLGLADCKILHLPPLPVSNFSSLTTLDLSSNNFNNSFIDWVFGISHLVYLDLSSNRFEGSIPDGLQNLTSLRHLDLSGNSFNDSIACCLYKFKFLQYLSLEGNNLQGAILGGLGNLTSIKILDLSSDSLEGRIPRSWANLCNLASISLLYVQLSQEISEILDIFSGCVSKNLEHLEFSGSQFSGSLTNQLGKFQNLQFLDVSGNSISGHIPSSFGQLSLLTHVDFSGNQLNGLIPSSIGNLLSLKFLSFSDNQLTGSIPLSLGQLSSLETLILSFNKLNGSLFPIHFVNLTRLHYFDVSGNSLMMKVHHDWVPPFQLRGLGMRSCHVGPQFPVWLLSQNSLGLLDISNAGIADTIPSKFWETASSNGFFNLSHNQIYGVIPNVTSVVQLSILDLSWNNLSGSSLIPAGLNVEILLDLSNNLLSGSIFQSLCYKMNGSNTLQILKLENNFLSGKLPDCWRNWSSLSILNLDNNKFTGSIPTSFGSLRSLLSLHLHKNRFSGIIPVSLRNCTSLTGLDISENEFVGNIPKWIGEGFSTLRILKFGSNKFFGPLPLGLCHLASLQVLDLAYNNLSGSIPRCINNFSNMVIVDNFTTSSVNYYYDIFTLYEDAWLVTKGKVREYNTILNLVRSVDLSNNKFSGEIPIEVTDLKALQYLNLSYNQFIGRIPENIGAMRSLESIDFSQNLLFGEIPQSMSSLTFLNYLNLSNNNLAGKIPLSTQLQSLAPSCFTGNDLCGLPLPKDCTSTTTTPHFESGGKDGNKHEVNWFYVSMPLGFMVGFWIVIGPLIINRRWRYNYYQFLDQVMDKFVWVVRNVARLFFC